MDCTHHPKQSQSQSQCFDVVSLTVDPDHPRYHALNGMLAIQVAGGGILGTVAPNAPKLPAGSTFVATVQPQNAIVNLHVDPDSICTAVVAVEPVASPSEFAQEMQALLATAIVKIYERSGQLDIDTQFQVGAAWTVTITPAGAVTVVDGAERVVFAEDWPAAVVQVPLSDRDARQLEAMLQERQAARSPVGAQHRYSFDSGLE